MSQGRQQHGELTRAWRKCGEEWRLQFDYSAKHHYDHQGNSGLAQLRRGVVIVFSNCDSEPHMDGSTVSFEVALKPGESWRACIDFLPILDGEAVQGDYACIFTRGDSDLDQSESRFKLKTCTIEAGQVGGLDAVVSAAVERARDDLVALRRRGQQDDEQADWLLNAGVPIYMACSGATRRSPVGRR